MFGSKRTLGTLSALAVAVGLGAESAAAQSKSYVLVGTGQGKNSTAFAASVAAAGGRVVANLEAIGVVVAESANSNFLAAAGKLKGVAQAAEDVRVAWIPDYSALATEAAGGPGVNGVNSEPLTGLQWNLRQIGADVTAANGDLGNGVKRARVAVLDSGIASTHPDIAPNLNLGLSVSFVPGEGLDPVGIGFNHGTHVAGIVAAPINDVGVQGVAPEAELVAVKVLSEGGSGEFGWLLQGIVYAAGPAVQADVINMSLGATFDRINQGGGGAGPLLAALNRAMNYASSQGTLCVSAAGNEGVDLNSRIWSIPAQSGNGMAVAATGPEGIGFVGEANVELDRPASYTNIGQSVVNVAAPGGDFSLFPLNGFHLDMVVSPGGRPSPASPGGRYYFAAGTSMAAPHVSGLAALIVGKHGRLPVAELKAIIEQSSVDVFKPGADPFSGKGRIDAAAALGY